MVLILFAFLCHWAGAQGWGWAAVAAAIQMWGLPASGALIGAGCLTAYYLGLVTQSGIMLLALLSLWIVFNSLTPESAIAAFASGVFAGTTVYTVGAGSGFGIGHCGWAGMARLSTLARHAWLTNLAGFLAYRLDFLFVHYITGAHGLGLYSTAAGIAELGRMAPNAVGQAAIRAIGSASEQDRKTVALGVLRLGLPVAGVISMGLAAASFWVIPALYGDAFAPAAPLMIWLAPGVASLAVTSVAASWLNVSGRSATTAKLSWWCTAAAAVISLLLILVWGIKGAAIASTIVYTSSAALTWLVASSRRPSPSPDGCPSAVKEGTVCEL
jgi:O-antigen/teichoic acid export membrane protein